MTAILLLGTYVPNAETLIQEDKCTFSLMTMLNTIARIWKQCKCPTIEEKWRGWRDNTADRALALHRLLYKEVPTNFSPIL